MSKTYGRIWRHEGGTIRQRGGAFQAERWFNNRCERHSEKTLALAKTWLELKRTEIRNKGMGSFDLSDRQRIDAVESVKSLGGKATLEQAVAFYLEHSKPEGERRTVAHLMIEYIEAKKNAGRRPKTLIELKYRIGKFAQDFGDRYVHEITTHDLEDWLNVHKYSGTTRGNFRTYFVGFWNYAMKHDFVTKNPAMGIEKPIVDEKTPVIFTPGDVAKLLRWVELHTSEMIPYFTIGIFAGLRPSEIQSLDWSSVKLDAKTITVRAETAKGRRKRLVDISDNLMQWLAPHWRESGLVHYSRKAFMKACRESGIQWGHDIMRHSFGSYHLAKSENAAATSLQMGHRNQDILFDNYRDLVTRPDAALFWSIRPASENKVIQFPVAAGGGA